MNEINVFQEKKVIGVGAKVPIFVVYMLIPKAFVWSACFSDLIIQFRQMSEPPTVELEDNWLLSF